MNRSKIIAIITGTIAIILAIAYLFIVQLLDFRGEMQPAPQGFIGDTSSEAAYIRSSALATMFFGDEEYTGDV